jgi:hypothetical protein
MNNNLHTNERRKWARDLYTKNNRNIPETAREVRVDEATVREWVRDGEWNTVRQSNSISKKTQLDLLYTITDELTAKMKEGPATTKEVDLLLKYTAAIKNLDTENSIYSLIETAELFITWLYRRSIPMAQTFTRHFELFIKERKAA